MCKNINKIHRTKCTVCNEAKSEEVRGNERTNYTFAAPAANNQSLPKKQKNGQNNFNTKKKVQKTVKNSNQSGFLEYLQKQKALQYNNDDNMSTKSYIKRTGK